MRNKMLSNPVCMKLKSKICQQEKTGKFSRENNGLITTDSRINRKVKTAKLTLSYTEDHLFGYSPIVLDRPKNPKILLHSKKLCSKVLSLSFFEQSSFTALS